MRVFVAQKDSKFAIGDWTPNAGHGSVKDIVYFIAVEPTRIRFATGVFITQSLRQRHPVVIIRTHPGHGATAGGLGP